MRKYFLWFATLLLMTAIGTRAQATFVKLDTATQTKWQGVYGSSGYAIPLGTVSPASFGGWSVSASQTWQWAAGATCWYDPNSFTATITITDGGTHQVAFWAQDYDKQTRVETVTPAGGATQTLSNFSTGNYLVYDVSGKVTFTFTKVSGPNAVLDGIFFDPGPGSPAPTTSSPVVTLNWPASTGATGYNIYRCVGAISGPCGTLLQALGVVLTYTDTTV